jgi:general L-amino acid transport system substrate-binding protein
VPKFNSISKVPMSWRNLFGVLLWVALLEPAGALAAPKTLETVRTRGYINCGVGENAPGLSMVNTRGQWSGIEVEFCAALAVAVFGKKDAVKFRALTVADRFKALQDGEVDVLLRSTAWTLSRDNELGLRFVDALFYDGQGFLVPKGHAVTSVLELSGASICVLPGSGGERSVGDFFNQRKMRFQLVTSDRWEQLIKAYSAGGCTALTGDVSQLAKERSQLPSAGEHVILPELVTKEPLGPAVRTGDDEWFGIVRWSFMALVAAEELGLTGSNIDNLKDGSMLDIRRFCGLEANLGQPLGLARDWAYQIVKQVGNYGEIFDRTLGLGSPLRLDRGINNLWTKGGLLYAAPFR